MKNVNQIVKEIVTRLPAKYRKNSEEIVKTLFLTDSTLAEISERVNMPIEYIQTVKNETLKLKRKFNRKDFE